MTEILPALTSAAVAVYRARSAPEYPLDPWQEMIWSLDDGVLHEAQRTSMLMPDRHPELSQIADQILTGELATLASHEGELDPMVLHPGGGSRLSPGSLITGLFSAAFQLMFYLRLPRDEGTYVRTVLEGYDELRRAVRGDPIRVHLITGVAGVTLPEGLSVTTPWGTLRPSPAVPSPVRFAFPAHPQSTCILAEPRLIPVVFDRAPEPAHEFDAALVSNERARTLFPLACALASKQGETPAGALLTWSTLLLPFQSGFSYSYPMLPSRLTGPTDLSERTEGLEEWGRRIEGSHVPSVEVAARRLVSSITYRIDKSDALIDIVMAWENLVGTKLETTFRVTAALSKLLEPDATKRRALRKELGGIYDTRSRLVHGDVVDPSSIEEAATKAIDVGARSLRASYLRGSEWLALSSTERADRLLLEEP